MNILVISDLHAGKDDKDWRGGPGQCSNQWLDILHRTQDMIQLHQPDVALILGDLIEPEVKRHDPNFWQMVRYQAQEHTKGCPHVFLVAGNNDVEMLDGPISGYAKELNREVAAYGMEVLDGNPMIVNNVGFAGNVGWWDGSLWEKESGRTKEHTYNRMQEFHEETFGDRADMTLQEFHRKCYGTLVHDIERLIIAKCRMIVVASHTVPAKHFLLYGTSPKYDYKNSYMGWNGDDENHERLTARYPDAIALHVCGHTHRSGMFVQPGRAPIVNVSGPDQQPYLFHLDD